MQILERDERYQEIYKIYIETAPKESVPIPVPGLCSEETEARNLAGE